MALKNLILGWSLVIISFPLWSQTKTVDSSLFKLKNITGKLASKSVVHNGKGLFFAQNMMYRHTVTVYDRKFELQATIKDQVTPSDFGFDEMDFKIKGGPVECAFSHNGKYAWVSNYNMTGGDSTQFVNPGCDKCSGTDKYDSSFLYQIDTESLQIIDIIKVGAIPKYVACTPDDKYALVSNWSSGDVSIVDLALKEEIKRVKVGTFPRGIVVDAKSEFSYVTVMGSTKLAVINLKNFEVNFMKDIGKGPRHLCISPDDQWLYLTLNNENRIAKIDLATQSLEKTKAGNQPRSMAISGDGQFLYVVNYNDATFSKIRTSDLITVAVTETKSKPIGIAYDDDEKNVWVACYSGTIQVFKDSSIKRDEPIALIQDLKKEDVKLSDENAAVAKLSAPPTVDDSIHQDAPNDEMVVLEEEFSLLPIRRLYWYEPKQFVYNVSKEDQPVHEEPILPLSEYELHSDDKFLVVVGSFGSEKNAHNLVEDLNSDGLLADTFFDEVKQMTRVYVYSTSSQQQLDHWITNKSGELEMEYWVLKQ